MAVFLSPLGNNTQFKNDGTLAVGYKIWTFAEGSSTPLATYTNATGLVAQANPVLLNTRGEVANSIYLLGGLGYKLILTDNSGDNVTIGTNVQIRILGDNIRGVGDNTSTTDQYTTSSGTATYISATSFSLVGDQTSIFEKGRALKLLTSGGTIYAKIASSAFTTLTTIVIESATGNLDTGITGTNPSYGLISNTNNGLPSSINTNIQNQTATAYTTGGTSAAFTLTPIPSLAAYVAGKTRFNVTLNASPTGSPTIAISGLGAINAKYYDSTGTKQFITSAVTPINWVSDIIYDGTDFVWQTTLSKASVLPQVTISVASNNLTIALAAGFTANYRSTTLNDGTSAPITSGAINLVIPSGATLGAPVAITSASATMAGTTTLTINTGPSAPIQVGAIIFQAGTRIGKVASLGTYVGGTGTGTVILDATATFTAVALVIINPVRLLVLSLNNGGTNEVAAINQSGGVSLDETGLISTIAITSGATSATTIYSTTSRTNLAYKVIGFIDIAEATVGTYALAPELVFSAIATTLSAMWVIGNGQTWQNLTTSRVAGINYLNITGRPIQLSISATNAGTSPSITIAGIAFPSASSTTQILMSPCIVPAGAIYSLLSGTTVNGWNELK